MLQHVNENLSSFFFFNDTATTEIYTLSLHDALPICCSSMKWATCRCPRRPRSSGRCRSARSRRSEEHTSELQSPCNIVCRLLLEKKKEHAWTIRSVERQRARSAQSRANSRLITHIWR